MRLAPSLLLVAFAATPIAAQESPQAEEDATPRQVVVRVVSGETRDPLPGLALRIAPSRAAAKSSTESVEADGDGVFRIDAPFEDASFYLFDEELAGWLDIGPESAELTLALLPPDALAVRVVDTDGVPVPGLPVTLRGVQRFAERTSSDGVALFPDARILAPPYDPPGLAAEVVLVETGHAPIRVPFDVERLPHGPVDVVLPPAGSLTVRVNGPDGRTERGAATAYLMGATEWMSSDERDRIAYAAPVRAGEATFPWVPDDLDVAIHVVSADSKRSTGRVTTRTPAKDAVVRVGRSWTAFVGRIVDDVWAPMTGRYVSARLHAPDGAWIEAYAPVGIPTDEHGAFRVEFDAAPERCAGGRLHLAVHTATPGGRFLRSALEPIPLAAGLRSAETDLGVLRGNGGDAVVTGRVVDPEGRPVSGLDLLAARFDGKRWMPVSQWRTLTGEDGAFALRGGPECNEIRIRGLDGRWYVPTPVVVSHGARDVEIVVRPCGAVEGTVVGGGGGHLEVRVLGPPAENGLPTTPNHPPCKLGFVGWRGRIRLNGLRPGRGRVEIVRGDHVAASFDDVEIVEGETCRDPRLQRVVLDVVATRTHTVTVHDTDGRALPRVRLRFTAGERGWSERETDAQGRAGVPAGATPPRVAVVRPGFATVMIDALERDETVVLRPLPVRDVTVRVRGLPHDLDASLSVAVQLVWCGRPGTPLPARSDSLDPRNYGLEATPLTEPAEPAVLKAWEPGVYAVRVWLRNTSGRGVALRTEGSPRAVVTSEGAIADVAVDIDRDHLSACVEHLDDR